MNQVFRPDGSFVGNPNTSQKKAWESLIPESGGFMKHPSLAPKRSVFAIFHQLHCLVSVLISPLSSFLAYRSFSNRLILGEHLGKLVAPSRCSWSSRESQSHEHWRDAHHARHDSRQPLYGATAPTINVHARSHDRSSLRAERWRNWVRNRASLHWLE